jgi:hypothetical protein
MAKNYCFDCGGWIPGSKMFMVIDPLWEKYGSGKNHLCLSCFEGRLGRALASPEFIDCVANNRNKEVAQRRKTESKM